MAAQEDYGELVEVDQRVHDEGPVGADRRKQVGRGTVHSAGFDCKGIGLSCSAPVEVHIDPASLPPLPDSRLLRLLSVSISLFVYGLSDSDICDAGGIRSKKLNMRIQDCNIRLL